MSIADRIGRREILGDLVPRDHLRVVRGGTLDDHMLQRVGQFRTSQAACLPLVHEKSAHVAIPKDVVELVDLQLVVDVDEDRADTSCREHRDHLFDALV